MFSRVAEPEKMGDNTGVRSCRSFYLCCAIVGTIVPWWFFASFFRTHGPNARLFAEYLFANEASAGFSIDVLISILVFWVWSFADARKLRLQAWWLVPVSSLCVGLSLSLPLYLYLRERVVAAKGSCANR